VTETLFYDHTTLLLLLLGRGQKSSVAKQRSVTHRHGQLKGIKGIFLNSPGGG
jgi:hypothetical protein